MRTFLALVGTAILVGVALAIFTPLGDLALRTLARLLPQTQGEPSITALEAAIDIGAFIERSQKEDGSFVERHLCENTTCIEVPGNDGAAAGYAIAALLAASQESGNLDTRASADKAIARILRLCENEIRVCERNFFALHAYYAATGENVYRTALVNAGDYIITFANRGSVEDVASRNLARKLSLLYDITGEERYRTALRRVANRALAAWRDKTIAGEPLYMANGRAVLLNAANIVGGIFAPAYQLLGDERYFTAAKNFLERSEISKNLPRFGWNEGMTAVLRTVEGLLVFSRVETVSAPDREFFATQALNIMMNIVAYQYDAPERPLFDGKGGLVTGVLGRADLPGTNYKGVNLNGFAAALLLDELMRDNVITFLP